LRGVQILFHNSFLWKIISKDEECTRCAAFHIDISFFGSEWLSRYSHSLRAGRSAYRIPVWARYFAPVQNCPGANPAFYTMGTGSFLGVNRPGRGVDHPQHHRRGQRKSGAKHLLNSVTSWTVPGSILPLNLLFISFFKEAQ
jgi:hypothetical protein